MNKFKSVTPFIVLAAIAVASVFIPTLPNFDAGNYSAADIVWVMSAAALVFLMTPGLAFFYGGMVNRKNVLSTMMKSVVAAGVVGVLWIVVGFSLCFGDSMGGFIGNPGTHLFFKGVASGEPWSLATSIPKSLFAVFQLMFAIITPGLVLPSGCALWRMFFLRFFLHYWCMHPWRTGAGIRMASFSKWEPWILQAEPLFIFLPAVPHWRAPWCLKEEKLTWKMPRIRQPISLMY
jgi:hypothetical protein